MLKRFILISFISIVAAYSRRKSISQGTSLMV